MAEVFLFAMLGGGLVALFWLVGREMLRRFGARRKLERNAEMVAQRERAALAAPGGSLENAIEVASPAVVESQARAMPCLRCGREVRVEQHRVQESNGRRVRVATVRCAHCDETRDVFFRLSPLH